jgi:hypothetical protein
MGLRHLLLLLLAIAALLGQGCGCGGSGGGGSGGRPSPGSGGGAIPAGLPPHFALGVSAGLGGTGWMKGSGTLWDYRFQYLSGNVNAGLGNSGNWSGWNLPAGDFARLYINESHANGWIPVLSYYCIAQSGGEANLATLTNSGTMYNYLANWKLLMQKCQAAGGTVIVHHEPDFWGFVQSKNGDNPASTPATVASSGFPEAAGFADNASGFARCLVGLRNAYGPNVLLAWHASNWATNFDVAFGGDGAALGGRVSSFFNALGANFDLVFNDFSDRDTGWYAAQGQNRAWDDSSFARSRAYLGAISSATGRKIMVWFIPCGNTLYRTCDNTPGHYQSNFAEFFLQSGNRPRIADWASGGIIGLLFGPALSDTTSFDDAQNDGTTNPAPINGNNLVSSHPDDDGGFIRTGAFEYYSNPVPLP